MKYLELTCSPSGEDQLIAELWDMGTTGIVTGKAPGGGVILKAFFEDGADLVLMAEHFRDFNPRLGSEPDRDWVAFSQSQWEPVVVGSRFFLAPAWRDDPTPPGRIRLEMRAGQACGSGWHTATQLCLEAMEARVQPGMAVFDVGAGSGILSSAAALLGAGSVMACDIEFASIVAAKERFEEEGLTVGTFTGSLRSVRSGAADLVIANIDAETVVALAEEYTRVLKPGGSAILSGFQTHAQERVLQKAIKAGGSAAGKLEREGWVALVCEFRR